MSNTELRADESAYLQAFLGGKRFGGYGAQMAFGSSFLMNEPALTQIYLSNGIGRRVVDTYAEETTRAGFCMEDMDEKKEELIQSKLEELGFQDLLATAMKWRGAFGGGLLVLGINDGGWLTDPVNENNIQGLEFIRVYNRFEVSRAQKYSNPASRRYGEVEMWNIASRDGVPNYYIHESRVLILDGESLPSQTRAENDGWGASVFAKVIDNILQLQRSHKNADLLLERLQQAVHSIPDLADLVRTAEGREYVRQRLEVVDAVRSVLNTLAIDAKEEYTVNSGSLTGVHELLDRKAEMVSAVTGIPMFVLFGRSIGGLNANGDTNRDAWNAQVASLQNTVLRHPVDRIVSLTAREFGNDDGGAYKLVFNPLSVPNDAQQAEIDYKKAQTRKTDADTAKVYLDANVLDQSEVRTHLHEEEIYPIDNVDKEIDNNPEPENDPQQAIRPTSA